MCWSATSRTARSRARDRAQKHLRAAEWIESLGRPDDHAEMVAHHYANALELARAAGQDVGGLAVRARLRCATPGDTRALNALTQAEHYYSEALALTEWPTAEASCSSVSAVFATGVITAAVEELPQEAQETACSRPAKL